MTHAFDLHDPAAKTHDDPDWKWTPPAKVHDPQFGQEIRRGRWRPRTNDPQAQSELYAQARGERDG